MKTKNLIKLAEKTIQTQLNPFEIKVLLKGEEGLDDDLDLLFKNTEMIYQAEFDDHGFTLTRKEHTSQKVESPIPLEVCTRAKILPEDDGYQVKMISGLKYGQINAILFFFLGFASLFYVLNNIQAVFVMLSLSAAWICIQIVGWFLLRKEALRQINFVRKVIFL